MRARSARNRLHLWQLRPCDYASGGPGLFCRNDPCEGSQDRAEEDPPFAGEVGQPKSEAQLGAPHGNAGAETIHTGLSPHRLNREEQDEKTENAQPRPDPGQHRQNPRVVPELCHGGP